jgi:tRNA pseudouridine55 synthase
VKPAAATVAILELSLLEFEPPLARLRLSVSSGTYVRSLAHDLGEKLGCGAHLEELRRTRIGAFTVEEAWTLEDLSRLAHQKRLSEALLSPAELLRELPCVEVSADAEMLLVHGRDVPEGAWTRPPGPVLEDGPIRVCGRGGELVSVAHVHAGSGALRPDIVLKSAAAGKAQEA